MIQRRVAQFVAGRARGKAAFELDKAFENLGSTHEIMSGLVPTTLGGLLPDQGFYVTPDTPADPTDCARYPNSPFCGGNPFTFTPIGIEPEIVNDGCNIGIRLNPALGFIRLPPIAIVYRKPECRKRYLPDRIDTSVETFCINPDCPIGTLTIGFTGTAYLDFAPDYSEFPVTKFYPALSGLVSFKPCAYSPNPLTRTFELLDNESGEYYNVPNVYIAGMYEVVFEMTYTNLNREEICYTQNQSSLTYILDATNSEDKLRGIAGSNYNSINSASYITKKIWDYWSTGYGANLYYQRTQYTGFDDLQIIYVYCSINKPPPPPDDPCLMTECCPCDDTLLKLLLKKINKLSDIVGVDRYPVELPKRLTYPNGTGQEKLKDLVEVLGFQVKQVDRAVGCLPQKIKVADTNPGLAGNQSVEVEIHSFADFAKEILQYVIDTEGDSDTTNNMLVRCLYELGFIHQGVVQGNAMLDASVEYFDFKHKWKKIRVPFAFDPYAGQKGKVGQGFDKQKNSGDNKTEEAVEKLLPALLTNTEVDIRILVNDEKKSLNDMLQDIKRDTAMAAAAVAEKSTPERLEQLVAAAQLMLQIQSVIDRRNMREALVAGNLKTRRIKK